MLTRLKEIELKDLVQIGLIFFSIAVGWGMISTKVNALEEKVRPLPQMQTDIEVVKSAIIDIKDGFKDLRRDLKNR